MEKLHMQTTNIVDENIKRIGELFSSCLTKRLDENGKPEVAIDFDLLRQELSKDIVKGPEERYLFTWSDKDVNETTITEIARQHPDFFVLRDGSLVTDNVADNFEQIWEEYGKKKVRKVI